MSKYILLSNCSASVQSCGMPVDAEEGRTARLGLQAALLEDGAGAVRTNGQHSLA